jgi:hypothetical protein
MRQGDVYATLQRLARQLEEANLDYAVVGGMAVVEHGYRRATEDIDLLMRKETLNEYRAHFLGRGYARAFPGAERSFRATDTGVRIDVVTTGDFPGDGKPKPVAFPDPAEVRVRGEEFHYVTLPALLQLKLASGLSAPHRMQDLADVLALIRNGHLPRELGDSLDASVRAEYLRLWNIAQSADREE